MPDYTAVQDVPPTGLSAWEYEFFSELKENIEILIGTRQSGVHALTNDAMTVIVADNQTMKRVSAQGACYTISGVNVASCRDFGTLINDVQQLANDVANIQAQVNAIIAQLRR